MESSRGPGDQASKTWSPNGEDKSKTCGGTQHKSSEHEYALSLFPLTPAGLLGSSFRFNRVNLYAHK